MVNVWSRGLGPLLLAVGVSGIALACSERDAATNPDRRRTESPPADRASEERRAPAVREPTQPTKAAAAGRDGGPTTPTEPAGGAGSEFHLDGADIEYETGRRDARPRKGRPIELVLRSTPPGAIAAIDGVAIGPTPAVWQGSTDGTAREFTFVLPGYAIARYRFIPMQSGVVHGTLGRLKSEPDAGPIAPDSP